MSMIPNLNANNNQNSSVEKWFRKVSNDEFYIQSPCVFTENPYHLIVGQVYEVHDMSKPDIELLYVKLVWLYHRGMTFHIIAVEIQTGELVYMSQRLGNESIPCSFLIADLLYFDFEEMSTKILRGLTDNDMELLEFDFSET